MTKNRKRPPWWQAVATKAIAALEAIQVNPRLVTDDQIKRNAVGVGARSIAALNAHYAATEGRVVIVARHRGAVDWLALRGVRGQIELHLTENHIGDLKRGDTVIGVLPLSLVAYFTSRGIRCGLIDLPDLTAGQRGRELSTAEMDAAGARLVEVTASARDWEGAP